MSSLSPNDPDPRIASQSSSPLPGSSPPQIAYSNGANGVSVQTNGIHQQNSPNGIIQPRPQQQGFLDGVSWQGAQFPDVLPDPGTESPPAPAPTINGDRQDGFNNAQIKNRNNLLSFIQGHGEGFQQGLNQGYDRGRAERCNERYNEGYDQGYGEGYDAGLSWKIDVHRRRSIQTCSHDFEYSWISISPREVANTSAQGSENEPPAQDNPMVGDQSQSNSAALSQEDGDAGA